MEIQSTSVSMETRVPEEVQVQAPREQPVAVEQPAPQPVSDPNLGQHVNIVA